MHACSYPCKAFKTKAMAAETEAPAEKEEAQGKELETVKNKKRASGGITACERAGSRA